MKLRANRKINNYTLKYFIITASSCLQTFGDKFRPGEVISNNKRPSTQRCPLFTGLLKTFPERKLMFLLSVPYRTTQLHLWYSV